MADWRALIGVYVCAGHLKAWAGRPALEADGDAAGRVAVQG